MATHPSARRLRGALAGTAIDNTVGPKSVSLGSGGLFVPSFVIKGEIMRQGASPCNSHPRPERNRVAFGVRQNDIALPEFRPARILAGHNYKAPPRRLSPGGIRMGFMDRLLGRSAARPATSRPGPASAQPGAGPSTRGPSSPQTVRKELVRVSVRDTLLHNGIPAAWIRADPLTTSAPGRETGVHVRLVVQHWDTRLMQCAVALQEHVEKRILSLDPQAENWLMGLSWQFDLEDVSHCPPMPHPGSWTATGDAQRAQPRAPQPAQPSADVISGPTRIGQTSPSGEDRREALERMMSERDADFRRDDGGDFIKTQPMGFEKTRPMSGFDKLPPGAPEQPCTDRQPPSGS